MGEKVTEEAVRRAIFLLGGANHGDALGGARLELSGRGVTAERRRLLEAVIRELAPGTLPAKAPGQTIPDVTPLRVVGLAIILAVVMKLVSLMTS
jgi:hypothetical protein